MRVTMHRPAGRLTVIDTISLDLDGHIRHHCGTDYCGDDEEEKASYCSKANEAKYIQRMAEYDEKRQYPKKQIPLKKKYSSKTTFYPVAAHAKIVLYKCITRSSP